VDEAPVYRTVVPKGPFPEALAELREGRIDIVTFTSSSTVRNLGTMLDGDLASLDGTLVACIGPITAQAARSLGLRVDIVAEEYTVEGLVRALKEYVTTHA
jgi:uroporphyrinogen III methyltransferase/synthase